MKLTFQNTPFSVSDTIRLYNHFMSLKTEGIDILACPRVNTFFLPEQNPFFSKIWKTVESPTIAYCNNFIFFRKKDFYLKNLNKFISKVIYSLYDKDFSLDLYNKGDNSLQVCINNISFTACFFSFDKEIFSTCLVIPHRIYNIFEKGDIQEHFSSEEIALKLLKNFKNGN